MQGSSNECGMNERNQQNAETRNTQSGKTQTETSETAAEFSVYNHDDNNVNID